MALTAVLGGAAIKALGYAFVLWPVAIDSLRVGLHVQDLEGRRPKIGHLARRPGMVGASAPRQGPPRT